VKIIVVWDLMCCLIIITFVKFKVFIVTSLGMFMVQYRHYHSLTDLHQILQ
jgi:hypothetical protein